MWQEGELKVEPGSGRYVEMPPFGYLFDGLEKMDENYLSSLRAPVRRTESSV